MLALFCITVLKIGGKLVFVDVLRGCAVLAVLLLHAGQRFNTAYFPKFLKNLFAAGNLGVQLFFFVSAFTLFLSNHLRSAQKSDPIRNFFIRRFFRIAPLYYLAILCYTIVYNNVLLPNITGALTPSNITWTAFFLNGFSPHIINKIVPGGWSVTVEVLFYCLTPLLFKKIKNLNAALYVLSLSFIFRAVCNAAAPHLYAATIEPSVFKAFLYFYFPNQFPVFVLGIIFYFIWKRNYALSYKAVLIASLLLLIQFLAPQTSWHIVFSLLFILIAFWLSKVKLSGVFVWCLQHAGRLSYSMYLTHFAVLFLLFKLNLFPRPDSFAANVMLFIFQFMVLVFATVLVSVVTYKLIEVPAQKLGKRLTLKEKSDMINSGF